MRDTYSLYEAKARLSALVKLVREGRTVVITVHGEPAVELRRIESEPGDPSARVAALAARGVVVRPDADAGAIAPVARKRGALKRFLDERD